MARGPKKDEYDVIVIGAGMGGLGAGGVSGPRRLFSTSSGKHYRAGGYAHSFRRKNYIFDSAVRIVAGAEGEGLLHHLLEKVGLADNFLLLNWIRFIRLFIQNIALRFTLVFRASMMPMPTFFRMKRKI